MSPPCHMGHVNPRHAASASENPAPLRPCLTSHAAAIPRSRHLGWRARQGSLVYRNKLCYALQDGESGHVRNDESRERCWTGRKGGVGGGEREVACKPRCTLRLGRSISECRRIVCIEIITVHDDDGVGMRTRQAPASPLKTRLIREDGYVKSAATASGQECILAGAHSDKAVYLGARRCFDSSFCIRIGHCCFQLDSSLLCVAQSPKQRDVPVAAAIRRHRN